jgi:ABC-2 type transport system permease protein
VSLARAEATRFTSRRFIRVMTVLIFIIFAIVAISIAANTEPITAADRAYAEQQVQYQKEQQKQWAEQEYQRCLTAVELGDGSFPPGYDCDEVRQKMAYGGPSAEQFLPTQFEFEDEIPESLMIAAAILCLFGFVVAASFVGAEWTSGGMVNLLLWRPRRLVVHTAKLGTALGGILVISVVYLGVWVGTLWLIAVTRGDPSGMGAGEWGSLGLTTLRALVLVLAASAVGFALASLGRHTAAALGIGVGYALVAELGALLLLDLTGSYFPERYRLSTYLAAWMLKEIRLYDYTAICAPSTVGGADVVSCEPNRLVIDLPLAGTVLGLVVAAIVALSYLSMHRRDVA